MSGTIQSDVEFYSMVHEVLRLSQAEMEAACRRAQERIPYACRQWIAPLHGGRQPAEHEYEEVDCRDISTGGFSYLSKTIPPTDKISVRLGKPDGWMFLNASVAHYRPVDTDQGPAFQVGCKFTGRVGV